MIPDSAAKYGRSLATRSRSGVRTKDLHWGHLPAGQLLGTVSAVFPRADAKLSIEKMRELEVEEYARQQALLGKTVAPAPETKITIDDFLKSTCASAW